MKPKIAVFSGPVATIQNSPDLVTSNKAREKYSLPALVDSSGDPSRFDPLRPQRLARPVTIYVEPFSAHPLERDEAAQYAEPDGYLDSDNVFSREQKNPTDRAVLEIELRPEDGLYPLPYMARRADGSAWEAPNALSAPNPLESRQTFYPDASRIYEEIDRFGIDEYGKSCAISSLAEFVFVRAAPAGGYRHTAPFETTGAAVRDSPPSPGEITEVDFFPYNHFYDMADPPRAALARLTNRVQETLSSSDYIGGQWLEGSPTIEDTLYWLNLLIDTTVPIVGHSAQRRRHSLGSDGDKNILDGVRYLISRTWADNSGRDRVGAVLIVDGLAFASRDVTKTAARPGNYEGAGGAGGVLAVVDDQGPPEVVRLPVKKHTHLSDVRITQLPQTTAGLIAIGGGVRRVDVQVRDADGELREDAIPKVIIEKMGFYHASDQTDRAGIGATIRWWADHEPLAGFVVEGKNPYGVVDRQTSAELHEAIFSGYPVVMTGRGNTAARATKGDPSLIAGSDLTSTKARMLLMAALLRFGMLPVAPDPKAPTPEDRARTMEAVSRYQEVFDSH